MTLDNYRRLGRTGLEVFPVGFGGIPIQRLDTSRAVEVVQEAIKQGINFIDTARAYSDSEKKIGQALGDIQKKVYLATKTPAADKEGALEDVDLSLGQLGVSTIDIYQLHGINDRDNLEKVMANDGALAGLKESQQDGRIDYIGITGHNDDILLEALKTGEFATVQFCYNYIENECEEKLIGYCKRNNIGMIAMKPLAGGRLNNAAAALKYVLQEPQVIPDPGMETKEEVRENTALVYDNFELTAEEKNIIAEDKEKLGTQFCRRCDYCQPCPEEIPISAVLRAESFINRMPVDQVVDPEGWVRKSFVKAEECTSCRQCVARCPYELPIPELIEENLQIMKEFLAAH